MIDQTVIDQLRLSFGEQLPDGQVRRIIFWHDVTGSFSEDFKELSTSDFAEGLPRGLAFAKMEDGSLFVLKKRILRDEPKSDFLVYTQSPRDFSEGR